MHYGNTQTGYLPGPECVVRIISPSNSKICVEVEAIIDSGAVMTCIPEPMIQELKRIDELVAGQDICLSGANGLGRTRETYYLNIGFPIFETVHEQVRVISLPGKRYALIGRDILNKYKVALNAREARWSLDCTDVCAANCEVAVD